MPVKVPSWLQEQYKTDDPEQIKSMKSSAERLDKVITEPAQVEKSLSADTIKKLCKEAGIEYKDGYEDRVYTFVISTDDVDRDSDLVKQDGIDLTHYMSNPVVLFAHNNMALPIGATLKITKSKSKTKALVLVYDDRVDNTGLSETINRMVAAGAIRGASIGFKPVEARFPTEDEVKRLKMSPYGVIFEKTLLLEWSICTVPANQNGLREVKSLTEKDFKVLETVGMLEAEQSTEETKEVTLSDIINCLDENKSSYSIILEKLDGIQKTINDLYEKLACTTTKQKDDPTGDVDDAAFKSMLEEIQSTIESVSKR